MKKTYVFSKKTIDKEIIEKLDEMISVSSELKDSLESGEDITNVKLNDYRAKINTLSEGISTLYKIRKENCKDGLFKSLFG